MLLCFKMCLCNYSSDSLSIIKEILLTCCSAVFVKDKSVNEHRVKVSIEVSDERRPFHDNLVYF